MKRLIRWFWNGLAIFFLMLFAGAAAIWVDHRVRTESETVIRPAMQIDISLLDVNPGMPTGVRRTVDLSGRIELPILGKVKAAGRTCAQLNIEINEAFLDAGTTRTPTFDTHIVGFQPPSGLFMTLLLVIPAVRVLSYCWSSSKTRRRLRAGLCTVCGYDLRASPDRCPECGTIPAASPEQCPECGTPRGDAAVVQ